MTEKVIKIFASRYSPKYHLTEAEGKAGGDGGGIRSRLAQDERDYARTRLGV